MSMIRRLASAQSNAGRYAALAMIGPATLGLWVYSRYRARGLWYAEYGSGGAMLIAVLVASIATFAAFGNFLDPRRRRLTLLWVVPSAIVHGSALFIAGCWFYPRPSLDGAEAALALRDFERAEAELDALEARDPGSPEVLRLRDQLPKRSAVQLRRNAKSGP